MPPNILPEDSQLISNLVALAEKSPKLVKSSQYSAPSVPEATVWSWKMNEHKYYDVPSPFPTLARGLFTTVVEPGKFRIVARGYDKFFNIGEVPWTTWRALDAYTTPPYTLSLKSNGCIIFIAALTPSKLLITSKHSLGPIQGIDETHAQAGERWLKCHLESKGKTTEELANTLWENNWTAIAELCDDSFEEHVLPYPPEKSGLHLHGINRSIKAFSTLLPTEVDAFADEWGFTKTPTIALDTVEQVRIFTDEVGKTGKWNGEPLEGFVVRTHVAETQDFLDTKSRPPYPPGSTFFFKVKFDEPYMMYRDWREVTKTLLSANAKGSLSLAQLPKSKLKRPETQLYVKWVKEEIKKDPAVFKEYNKGKGIIRTRERFLAWMSGEGGKGTDAPAAQNEEKGEITTGRAFGKTIIAPVAVPGCGKTTISIALAHLFGFGHTQSDDVGGKKPSQTFLHNVVRLLAKRDVVIADKNNHLREHRAALRAATAEMEPPVRLLALDWSSAVASLPSSTTHRICSDRIVRRGDSHQTLPADASEARSHEEVVWMFINKIEELGEEEVDDHIEMQLEENGKDALKRAVDGVVKVLGLPPPDEKQIEEALAIAATHSPKVNKKAQKSSKKKKGPKTPRYYALLPEIDLKTVVSGALSAAVHQEGQKFWAHLEENNMVTPTPHITIVHTKELPHRKELWQRCADIQRLAVPPQFAFKLGTLVWNERVMALTVDDMELDEPGESGPEQEVAEFVSTLTHDAGFRLHITVGTRDASVSAFEAKVLTEDWRSGKEMEGVYSLGVGGLVGKGRLKGLIQ